MPDEYAQAWGEFSERVRQMLVDGQKKGYCSSVRDICPGYTLGEIIHKATRYRARQDDTDLVKIAGHAFLAFADHNRRKETE